MHRFVYLSWVLIVVALAGCASSAPKVFTDSDVQQDFSDYQTFAWISEHPMTTKGDKIVNPLIEARLMAIIVEALEQKGYQFVESSSEADFTVSFSVGALDKVDVWSHPNIVYGSHLWRYRYSAGGQINTDNYTEGSLAIDVFDRKRNQAVWHGMATERLSDRELQEETSGLGEVAAEIIANFPASL